MKLKTHYYPSLPFCCDGNGSLYFDLVWFGLFWVDLPESTGGDSLAAAAPAAPGAELMSGKNNICRHHADVYSRGHTNMLQTFHVNISISVKHID